MVNVNPIKNKLKSKKNDSNGVKDIISIMSETPSPKDRELIEKAFVFAQDIHKNSKRLSGEPFLCHPIETAKTLAKIGMGPRTIIAGLLHDALEDTKATEEEIREKFGEEILFLVQGVTKLGQLKYRGVERHIGSLQKLFVATSQDIRVLIIKLADRLHNMETLEHLRPDKQKRIAIETLEIYAPLAYRLGIRSLNRGLEDLAFKYVHPKEHDDVRELLKQKSENTVKRLEKTNKSIKKALAKENLTDVKTDCRVKGLYSLFRKLQRKDWDIEKIYDIAAIRLVVPTVADCYKALGILHGTWRPLPNRIKDYIAFTKPNGYQSLHTTIFTGDGTIVEVQIRTPRMHREAEYGIASHFVYKEGLQKKGFNPNLYWLRQLLPKKEGGTPVDVKKSLSEPINVPQWIKQLVETQQNISEPQEFIKNLKADFFEHRIFVFTPKGDVVDLPVDSSPIDFAYAVHSDIGNHISGTKVNGKMVSLDTKLGNGDIVEIQTKESSKPTQKWQDIAKTTLARRHIRLQLQNKESKSK